MIKLSDYIAEFLKDYGVKKVFVIQGGASAHLIDSLAKCEGIEYVCNHHEQASAMAAMGYAQSIGCLGAAVATSGPGATNLLTGCCSAYYDSIPVLFLTGQVASFRLKGSLGIRQLGFQETDTTAIFKSIVKYCSLLERPEDIRYELEKAVSIAMAGRKGPVLLDIPDDFQRTMIDEKSLRPYDEKENIPRVEDKRDQAFEMEKMRKVVNELQAAERPVIIAGRGIHLAGAEDEFRELVHRLCVPVLCTWGANDLLEETDELKIGTFGINGTRYGNFALQKSDYMLVIGSRLDTHTAGTPLKKFGKRAKKIIVDLDEAELDKYESLEFGTEALFCMDAKEFLHYMLEQISNTDVRCRNMDWEKEIIRWKQKYPVCEKGYWEKDGLNPYVFVKILSDVLDKEQLIFCDTGCSFVWINQAFEFKRGQRIHSSFNNTPMGYALPAAIGASFTTEEMVLCITGDGGLLMNIQELALLSAHGRNVKLLLFENQGYGMLQRTQDMWFDSCYEGSDREHGLYFPDFSKILQAYEIFTVSITYKHEIRKKLQQLFEKKGPACAIIKVSIDEPIYPQLKFGHDLEDLEPYISKEELERELSECKS